MRSLRYIIFALLLGSALVGATQSTFEVVNPSGCAPFGAVIHVEGPTGGNTYLWQITTPNGSVITSSSTTYVSIFTIPGTYDVSLTINGTSTETVQDYITVYAPPTADFNAITPIGCAPHCTDFNNTSTAGTSPITEYSWDFGDGYTSTEQNPNHCYEDAGNYSPVLSITDANGCFSNLFIASHVQVVLNVPESSFQIELPNSCELPTLVEFTADTEITDDLTYAWTLNENQNLTPAHETSATIQSPGTNYVCLISTDEFGCSSQTCQVFEITEYETPTFTVSSTSVCVNSMVSFSLETTNTPSVVSWDFDGNGTIDSYSQNASFSYANSGIYTPQVTCEYQNGCIQQSILNTSITVYNNPSVTITSPAVSSCTVPFEPIINSSTANTGQLTYSWMVDNIQVASTPNLQYSFVEAGNYDISVQISDANGCISLYNSSNLVSVNTPQINLVHYTTACVGQPFSPTDLIINTNSPIAVYNWDFDGDGITDSNSSDPEYIYDTAGQFSMSLEIITNDGCNSIYNSPDIITVLDSIETGFTWNYTNTCAAQFIEFCAPPNTPSHYSWKFGDGGGWQSTTNTINCVSHTYADTGYYDIRVRVSQGACLYQDTLLNFIHISAPIAKFTFNVDCTDHKTVTVYDESIGATELRWDFGDGSPFVYNETITAHTYEEFGDYQIRLIAGDGNEQCDYEEVHTVRLIDPSAELNFSQFEGCAPLFVDVEPLQSNNYWEVNVSNGDHFIADWNGGQDVWEIEYNHNGIIQEYNVPLGTNFWPTFTFNQQGCYDFNVLAYDRYNCPTTANYENIVCSLSDQNFANFSYNILQNCDPVEISFSAFGANVQEVEWNFGDGFYGAGTNITHVFEPPFNDGLNISMIATDTSGCTSESSQTPEIVLPTVPNFQVASATTCLGQSVDFENLTTGEAISFHWDFGDQTSGELNISDDEQPSHTYYQNGMYTVCLEVTSPSGCTLSRCQEAAIQISTPEVSFEHNSTMDNCLYGVSFTNTSAGNNNSYLWSFGDGQFSTDEIAYHTYPLGVFSPMLTVTGSNGCSDSLMIPDIFNYSTQIGPYTAFVEELSCAPYHVEFQAFDTTDLYFTYFWDFADGSGDPSGSVFTSHDYMEVGEFCPQLIMTDPNGCEVFVPCETPIEVSNFEITHNIPTEMCVGDSVVITMQNADSYLWNNSEYVEEGITPSEFVIHPIQSIDFIITGTMGDCQSMDTVHVTVHSLPEVTLELPEQICFGAESFHISGGYPEGETGQYELNGLPVVSFNPNQNADEWYAINYSYVDSNTCANSALDSIYIRPLPFVTIDNIEPLCENSESIEITGGMPEQGAYMMGDSIVTTFNPSIGFGIYTLQYTYTDSIGCTSNAQREIVVHAVPEIHLSFDSTCANIPFELINNSFVMEGQIDQTEWTFGDQSSVFGSTPGEVGLSEIGENSFHVKMETLQGCISELDTLAIVLPVPQTTFSIEDGCAGSALEFVSGSTTEAGYMTNLSWIFSEENIGAQDTLTYSFNDWGSQTLTLISENNFGCIDTLSQQVSVYPLPELEVFSSDVCLGETSVFTSATNIAYGTIESSEWIIEDSLLTSSAEIVSHLFAAPGSYTAYLIAQSDLGCVNMDSVDIYVNNGPVVEFTVEQPGYCPESDVYLFDLSSIDSPGSSLTQWAWYFDGELMSTEPNPMLHLVEPASYDVTLVVTTNTGCSGELTMDNFITVYPKPIAGFSVENSELNMANPFLQILNSSSNDVTSWTYDFGDGTIETFEEGAHEYADWTNYTILQTVSNIFGCMDTASYSVTVLPSIIVNIPNAFTPDGNGHNDLFFPVLYGSDILFFEFEIYDRWGRLMYGAASTKDGWDGTIRETGEMAPCGVYNWKMSIRTIDQPLMKTTMGSVMLIK